MFGQDMKGNAMKKRLLLRQGATGLTMVVVLIVMAASAWADSIYVPDANFNTIYKPGYTPGSTTVVSATSINGWANFVGTSTLARLAGSTDKDGNIIINSTVSWSDGTSSSAHGGVDPDYIDFPSWIGSGGVQQSGSDNSLCLAQNGNERVRSTASLGTIAANTDYTLSADAKGVSFSNNAATYNRLYLELLADDTAVTTASEIATTGSFVNYSVIFTAAQLQSYVGKLLKIEVGGFGGYDQVQIDNVTLTTTAVPEPMTLVSLVSLVCTVGLFLGVRRWRRG